MSTAPLVLALDRAPENRYYDKFGRLHVRVSNIAKECVSPYRGKEIPGYEELKLDPDKIYALYRPFEELEKAVDTFNNQPLLQIHVPVTPDAPSKEEVVGSTGTDCVAKRPFLQNSLVIWVRDGIQGVETEEQQEISPGYSYDPDMTPGSFEGLHYDGIMRNIVANHVALVSQGRQGPDVVVGDAKPETELMAKAVLKSRKAILIMGGLSGAVLPLLATDQKPVDFSPALVDVTAKNFKDTRGAVAKAVKTLMVGVKLAADADMDSLVDKVLDRLADVKASGDDDSEDMIQPAVDEDPAETPASRMLAFCKGKMGEDDLAELMNLADEKYTKPTDAALDEGDPDAPDAPEGGAPKPGDKPQAMDAAAIEQRIARRFRDAAEAREIVHPIVGKVSLALDSAAPIYELALDHLQIAHTGLNLAGKKALVEQHLSAKAKAPGPVLALDASDAQAEFDAMYPTASKLKRV